MPGQRPLITTSGWALVGAGVALAVVRYVGEVPPGRGLECAVGSAALGGLVAAPGVLALLARAGRTAMLLPAAWLLVPLSFLSFAGLTLPLLVPAFLLFRAYLRSGPHDGGALQAGATTGAVLVLLVAAVVVLFVSEDPREWSTATASYSTSNVISYGEAVASLALTTAAVSAGFALSAPPSKPVSSR